ncbi:MAG: carboxylate-amine ligase [Candidatus Sericytochromatia bacterium]|nr:carboxylate-amine ligase [Candidatus Sericytochromatia bacterium]
MPRNLEQFTIGVEEEYQIVDPDTRELKSHISALLEEAGATLGDALKPEMHQSVIEVGTGICKNVQEARADVARLRKAVADAARKGGMRIAAASSHPFSDWRDQAITDRERYHNIVEDLQDVARGNLVFGLHCHIGIPDRDLAIEIFNEARYFLPHILALSTSSPFWLGRQTGLKSVRCIVFKRFPRTGIPETFRSWGEFESYVDTLIKTGCIDDGKRIWWDLRPHSFFNTIEFRICDLPTSIDDTIAIVALIQALVAKLYVLRSQDLGFRVYSSALIEENKWRAYRYGIHGKLIDFGMKAEKPTPDLIEELLAFVDDVVDELGSRKEVEHVRTILKRGTSADRQLEIYRETNDLKAVVDWVVAETTAGIEAPAATGA